MISRSVKETKKIASAFAKMILKTGRKRGAAVLALKGNLGSGKTTFIQGFIKAAGIGRRVTSPTFLIIKSYKSKVGKFKRIYHIDAYRIKKAKELLDLGFKKIAADPQNIILIEWADKIKRILPKGAIWINFDYGMKENERRIDLRAKRR